MMREEGDLGRQPGSGWREIEALAERCMALWPRRTRQSTSGRLPANSRPLCSAPETRKDAPSASDCISLRIPVLPSF